MQIQTLPILNRNCNLINNSSSFSAYFPFPCRPQTSIHCTKFVYSSSTTNVVKVGVSSVRRSVCNSPKVMKNDGDYSLASEDDRFYIRRAVENARKAIGCTSPNPMVGCVIVKNGEIIGEGFHPKAGQPHAEVFALRDAGESAENGTAYVTLEPCNHYGRTPPCSDALIKAKVKRVVIGMVDPNPIVASRGVERLRDAGIEVIVGVEEELCKQLNEAYIHKMLTEKPFVTLRYTITINGHLTSYIGEGAKESGGYYSRLLQEYDAVICSSSSLKDDNFIIESKEPGAKQPLRIVIAKSPNSPIQIPSESSSQVIVFTDKETVGEPELSHRGIETVLFDNIKLSEMLKYCKDQGFCSVLLDLRGSFGDFDEIIREGFEENLLQKVVVEMSPIWGKSEDEGFSKEIKNLGQRVGLKNFKPVVSGNTVLLEGYF